jgi:hypothetical protein
MRGAKFVGYAEKYAPEELYSVRCELKNTAAGQWLAPPEGLRGAFMKGPIGLFFLLYP